MVPAPGSVESTTADLLYQWSAPFLMREAGQDDDAWLEVARAGPSKFRHGEPERVTVVLADGYERLFNPGDSIEVGQRPEPRAPR